MCDTKNENIALDFFFELLWDLDEMLGPNSSCKQETKMFY